MCWLPRLALISSGQSGGQQGSSSLVQIGVRPEESTTKPVPITAAKATAVDSFSWELERGSSCRDFTKSKGYVVHLFRSEWCRPHQE